jgi:putative DNA primase/helicase
MIEQPTSSDLINGISIDEIMKEATSLIKQFEPVPHNEILNSLLQKIERVDFREKAGLIDEMEKLQKKHYIVCTVDLMLEAALFNNWKLCRNDGQTFIFNGAYWKSIERELLQSIFGQVAEKMGVPKIDARHYLTRRDLIQQFEAVSYLPAPERDNGRTLINLKNGTFEITSKQQYLRPPSAVDFLTYQLPFNYDPEASAPLFMQYLDQVQPDKERQAVLQEYLGYVFTSPKNLKLEKVLLLIGGGANGKSVFIEVVNALLGRENVSSYSLQTLTEANGYTRAQLATKLLNCVSEISGRIGTNDFKLLASGEPIEARHIYGSPFVMENYAKLLFATNELPKEVEQTNGFFRRWLIVPFDVTIPEAQQDKELPRKIIEAELSGVFNWVLEGLRRLLINKRFTECEAVNKKLEEFKHESDSVAMFIQEEGYAKCALEFTALKDVFAIYREYCNYSNFRPCSIKTFGERLRNSGFEMERKNYGQVVFLKK